MIYVGYIVLLIVYWCCPKYLKLVATLINFFMPDPIPCVDEIVMVAGLLASKPLRPSVLVTK